MAEPQNLGMGRLLADLFAELVAQKFRFLLLVCGALIVMILYGSGVTWGSVLACIGLLLVLGLFWGLTSFWIAFFRGFGGDNGDSTK